MGSDRVVGRGGAQSKGALRQPVRLLEVATGTVDGRGRPEVLLRATRCLARAAEFVAVAYPFRGEEELCFRWFKWVRGRRHRVSERLDGGTGQV